LPTKQPFLSLRTEQIEAWRANGTTTAPWEEMHKYGTSITTYNSAHNGDSPVKELGGYRVIDLPDISGLHHDASMLAVEKAHGAGIVRLVVKEL